MKLLSGSLFLDKNLKSHLLSIIQIMLNFPTNRFNDRLL